jgi:hypothetical protein
LLSLKLVLVVEAALGKVVEVIEGDIMPIEIGH